MPAPSSPDPARSPDWGTVLPPLLLRDETLQGVLLRVARMALEHVPAAESASLTLLHHPGRAVTVAWTGLVAYELDESQYTAGDGPCMSAARTGEAHVVPDISTDLRWPAFRQVALARHTLSCVSVPVLGTTTPRAALNLYAAPAGALTGDVLHRLGDLHHVGTHIANAHDYAAARTAHAGVLTAMESRAVIEQAKGILMARSGITAEQAFDQLSAWSSHTNTKLRTVAEDLVHEVGDHPEAG